MHNLGPIHFEMRAMLDMVMDKVLSLHMLQATSDCGGIDRPLSDIYCHYSKISFVMPY